MTRLSDLSDEALLAIVKERGDRALELIKVNPDAAFTAMQEGDEARSELLKRYPR